MAYAEQTTELLNLSGNDEDKVTEALEAGAADIDAAFRAGGYAVPLDLAGLEEPGATRWAAKIAVVNRHLAARTLSSASSTTGARGQAAGVKKDHEEALAFLKSIAEGSVVVDGLARSAGATGIRVVGDAAVDADAIADAHTIRGAPELAGDGFVRV